MNNADIEVINKQTIDGKTEEIKTSYPCRFMEKNGAFYILYNETELSENVTTKIRVKSGSVTITRCGAYESEMVYIEGEEQSFAYSMPYGTVNMTVKTGSVRVNLTLKGGKIELSYTLLSLGQASENSLTIKVRERI